MPMTLRCLPLADMQDDELYGPAAATPSQIRGAADHVERLTGCRPTVATFWEEPDAPGQDLPPTARAGCL